MGFGEIGLLGHGTLDNKHIPSRIEALEEAKIDQVECGGFHSVGLSKSGAVYVWGRGDGGQLGLSPELILKRVKESK